MPKKNRLNLRWYLLGIPRCQRVVQVLFNVEADSFKHAYGPVSIPLKQVSIRRQAIKQLLPKPVITPWDPRSFSLRYVTRTLGFPGTESGGLDPLSQPQKPRHSTGPIYHRTQLGEVYYDWRASQGQPMLSKSQSKCYFYIRSWLNCVIGFYVGMRGKFYSLVY